MTTWTTKLAAARSRRRTKAALAAVERMALGIAHDWGDVDEAICWAGDRLVDTVQDGVDEIEELIAARLDEEAEP